MVVKYFLDELLHDSVDGAEILKQMNIIFTFENVFVYNNLMQETLPNRKKIPNIRCSIEKCFI
jgi:hypothetical protein